jgi:hypothetical protein
MRSSRRGNLLLRNPLARGECAVRILFYRGQRAMQPRLCGHLANAAGAKYPAARLRGICYRKDACQAFMQKRLSYRRKMNMHNSRKGSLVKMGDWQIVMFLMETCLKIRIKKSG